MHGETLKLNLDIFTVGKGRRIKLRSLSYEGHL